MKINKIAAMAAAAVLSISMASCLNHGENVSTQTIPGYINAAFDAKGDLVGISSNIGYTLSLNSDSKLADVVVEGFKMPDGQKYTALNFNQVPWHYSNDAAMSIFGANITPTSTMAAPAFDLVSISLYPRYVGSAYLPFTKITFVTNGYTIHSLPTAVINAGKTVVKTPQGQEYTQGENEQSMYAIVFDPDKMTATINIQGAKFAANMPAMNMRFKDIPFTVHMDGKYQLSRDALIPYIVGGNNTEEAYENYPITNLYCSTDAANNMILNFTCTVHMKLPGGTEASIPYSVNVTCEGPNMNFAAQYAD